ncbi:hypothetical protein DM01DRAFT_1205765 [Hesseltinella vesiculosa]|uniref:F-box domain-containing protein n=1 Tax=Hesseltinella vesiculosa TaxID=101127 RepID=A0A1X2GPK8_9FUNG|nr:hypothetical protein DM01DRAFT_1205765 [Hesseltinella vesiculosa]
MAILSQLPSEILQLISTYVTLDDLFTLCCTSRLLHDCLLPILYRDIPFTSDRLVCDELTTCDSQPLGHSVRSVVISCRYLTLNQLNGLTATCPLITSLTFADECFRNLLRCLANQKFYSTSSNYNALCPFESRPYGKPILDLKTPPGITSPSQLHAILSKTLFQSIFQQHPQLTTLGIDNVFGDAVPATIQPFVQILPNKLVHLSLNFGNHVLSIADVECIHDQCPLLKTLSLKSDRIDPIRDRQKISISVNHVLKSWHLSTKDHWFRHWPWLWFTG